VFEGVGGGLEFAFFGAGPGGLEGIGTVGGEGCFGHGFRLPGGGGRGIVGQVLLFVHGITPEEKLTGEF